MEPVISFAVFTQMKVLTNAEGDRPPGEVRRRHHRERRTHEGPSHELLSIVTFPKPHFGYMLCVEMAKEGYTEGKSLHQIVAEERKLMTEDKWNEVFSFQNRSSGSSRCNSEERIRGVSALRIL